jgi:glycosyltransferase involved in cell wall biosynthesis
LNQGSISGVILTYNETLHIERAIRSLQQVCQRVIIVDSFSTDKTLELARNLGADVYQNAWENNHSKQMNWALQNTDIRTNWVLRLDADEILEDELVAEIRQKLSSVPEHINGIVFKRKNIFLGKWIRFGGYYPIKLIRLWRVGKGYSEQRLMDEHVVVENNATQEFSFDLVDKNLNDISWWTQKHINYAKREAADFFHNLYFSQDLSAKITKDAAIKRWLKDKFYYKLPLGIRPFLYFFLRYVFRLGFLDGKSGFLFHFLQGYWYRLLVDINISEVRKICKNDPEHTRKHILEQWSLDIKNIG